MSAAGILTLAESGLNICFGNIWQKAFATGDETTFRRMIGVAIFLYGCVILLLLTILAAFLTTGGLPELVAFHAFPRQEAQLVFALLAATVIVRLARGSVSQIYRGRGEFARGTLIGQAQIVLNLGIVATAAWFGARPTTLAGLEFVGELLLGWGLLLFDLRRRYAISLRPIVPNRSELATIARVLPWFAIQQGMPVLWLQLPVLLMGALGTASTALVGFINLRTLVNIGRMPVTLLSIAAGVEFASSHFRDEREAAAKQLIATGRLASAIMSVVAVAVVLFGPTFVLLWTGRDDLFDMRIAIVFLIGAVIAAPTTPIANFLGFINEPRAIAVAALVQIAVGIFIIALLAPSCGALGAAIGLATGEVAFAIVLPSLAGGLIPFRYFSYVLRCVVTVAFAAAWSALVGTALQWLAPTSEISSYGLKCVLFVVLAALPVLIASAPSSLRQRGIDLTKSLLPATRT